MVKNIVVIGDSPLSSLIVRQLDRHIARNTHINVTHISRDDKLVCPTEMPTLLGKQVFRPKTDLYREARLVRTMVRQINLADHRLITADGLIDYDLLVIDQTPTYTASELKKIGQTITRLISEIKAKNNRGGQVKARITLAGQDAASWQLALVLAEDLASLSSPMRRSLVLQAQLPLRDGSLKDFLTAHGVEDRKSIGLLPGMTIAAAKNPVNARLVRGALLDDQNNFITTSSLNPDHHPELIVISAHQHSRHSLLRVDQNLAEKIARNVELYLEGRHQRSVDWPREGLLLRSNSNSFVRLGSLTNRRLRAKLIGQLDRRFYQQLFRAN